MSQNTPFIRKLVFAIPLLLNLIVFASVATQEQELPMDTVNALLDPKTLGVNKHKKPIYSNGILNGRYMEQDIHGKCADATFKHWDEFHLKQCTYNQPDKKFPQGGKTATVIMLNPEKEVLAKWLVASCMIVKGNVDMVDIKDCAVTLAKAVIEVSGSQFAIAGIVLEDELPRNKPDGVQEAYTFRDGVTVIVQDGMSVGFTGGFGTKENDIALEPNRKVLSTASNMGPARIQNTTREDYRNYMGHKAKDVNGIAWVDVVRELYQDAWKRAHDDTSPETVQKYRNDLMVAKCYSLMGVKPPE